MTVVTAVATAAGCATGQNELVDRQLQLLEAQFSKLEQHTVPRGPAATGDPKTSLGLPVVKLHKLNQAGWRGASDADEPEIRTNVPRQAARQRFDSVQRPQRGVAQLDDSGNLLNADGKVVYRAGTGSPDRRAEGRRRAPKRVWEPRPPDKGEREAGIKPMPRLKQFQLGGSEAVPQYRDQHIRVESAPPAPPIPESAEAHASDAPEQLSAASKQSVASRRAARAAKRAADKRAARAAKRAARAAKRAARAAKRAARAAKRAAKRADARRPSRSHPKPVPLIAQAPSLDRPRAQVVSYRAPKVELKPMPKLRSFPAPRSRVKKAKKVVIKRAPGPQRMTRQTSFSGKKERKVQRIYKRALEAFRSGEDRAAGKGFGKVLRYFWRHELADNALYWLGETTYRQGRWLQALSYFQDIIIRYPDGNKVGDAMVKSALCYARLGDTSYAQKVLADVESLFPSSRLSKVARERRLALGHGDS